MPTLNLKTIELQASTRRILAQHTSPAPGGSTAGGATRCSARGGAGMEVPIRKARSRRARLVVYAAGLSILAMMLLPSAQMQRSSTASGGGGNLPAAEIHGGASGSPLLPHKRTAKCVLQSYAEKEPQRCRDDAYARPFSGCLSDAYEQQQFQRFLAGKPVSNLRCGFLDAPSRAWLASVHERFARCKYVVFTASFSYGQLPTTDNIKAPQPGVCFGAFVDEGAVGQLDGVPGFNGTHYGRWELIEVDPGMISDTPARSAHMIKILAVRLFPDSDVALYIDIKIALPPSPVVLLRAVEQAKQPITVAVIEHPPREGRDVFDEIATTLRHLYIRRLRPELSKDKLVHTKREAYLKGITGRDFHDIFRQYDLFHRLGYPTHDTGMFNAATLVWNLRNPCTAALACLWHNQVALYSMREQLNFHYVLNMLGLTRQVMALTPIPNTRKPSLVATRGLRPITWPDWGSLSHDEYWGE